VALQKHTHPMGLASFILNHGIGFLYCFATVVIMNGIFRGETSVARYFSLSKSKTILEETVAGLKKENLHLREEINRINESAAYARKILREKYHVTDEDEKIIYYAD
jgi:cell division protein FtsB